MTKTLTFMFAALCVQKASAALISLTLAPAYALWSPVYVEGNYVGKGAVTFTVDTPFTLTYGNALTTQDPPSGTAIIAFGVPRPVTFDDAEYFRYYDASMNLLGVYDEVPTYLGPEPRSVMLCGIMLLLTGRRLQHGVSIA